MIGSCQLSSIHFDHVNKSLAICAIGMLPTCSSQCHQPVQHIPYHVISCLYENACKRFLAIKVFHTQVSVCPYIDCMCWTETLTSYTNEQVYKDNTIQYSFSVFGCELLQFLHCSFRNVIAERLAFNLQYHTTCYIACIDWKEIIARIWKCFNVIPCMWLNAHDVSLNCCYNYTLQVNAFGKLYDAGVPWNCWCDYTTTKCGTFKRL